METILEFKIIYEDGSVERVDKISKAKSPKRILGAIELMSNTLWRERINFREVAEIKCVNQTTTSGFSDRSLDA